MIVLYNWHHKANPLSPFVMGLCRMLVYTTCGLCFVAVVGRTLERYRDRYSADGEAAAQLIAYGESKADPEFASTELAAYTLVANLLLNLDEAVSRN